MQTFQRCLKDLKSLMWKGESSLAEEFQESILAAGSLCWRFTMEC